MFTKQANTLSSWAGAGALSACGRALCTVQTPFARLRGDPVFSVLTLIRSRAATLVSVCGLALMQTACAHPVVVQPSVAVQGHLGGPLYGSIYAGPMHAPAPVVVAPRPVWVLPPPTVMPPRVMLPPPAYHPPRHHRWRGQGFNHGWGRRGW